jgi:TatD DNase family protein
VWVSFGGTITYPDARRAREAVRAAPLERVFVETDAPYLAPHPKAGKRPKDNEPAYLPRIAEVVAESKGETAERVLAVTAENARQAFGLRGEDG